VARSGVNGSPFAARPGSANGPVTPKGQGERHRSAARFGERATQMAAGFFGRYEHSLDAKGRLILPSKFRASFEHGGYLTQYHDGCLALFTPDEFETQMQEMQTRSKVDPRARNLARYWAAGTQDVAIDVQGRLPIAGFLREFAQLNDEVLVHGAIDRIELWSPLVWAHKTTDAASSLLDGDDV